MRKDTLVGGLGWGLSIALHALVLVWVWQHVVAAGPTAGTELTRPVQAFLISAAAPMRRVSETASPTVPAHVQARAATVSAQGATSYSAPQGPATQVETASSSGDPVTLADSVALPAAPAPVGGKTTVQAQPDYQFNPPPEYPLLLRDQAVGGVVWVRVWVEENGLPGQVALVKGSGYRLLDESALRAVRHWRFLPARSGDRPFASWVEFPVKFSIQG